MKLCATAEDTARLARETTEKQHLPAGAYRLLGKTGLTTSVIGFGGYRIDSKGETHRAALRQALRRGVNLIDTSSNYTDGESESLIGEMLGDDSADPPEDAPRRSGIILVSKVGYVQGQNMKLADLELVGAGHEVRLAVDLDQGGRSPVQRNAGHDAAFRSGTPRFATGLRQSSFTQELEGFLCISLGLHQNSFAVHHAGVGLVPKCLDLRRRNLDHDFVSSSLGPASPPLLARERAPW